MTTRTELACLVALGVLLPIAGCSTPLTSPPAVTATSDPLPSPGATLTEPEANGPLLVTARPWQYGDYSGHVLESDNYQIHTTIASESLRERLPRFFEGALEYYTTVFGPLPVPEKTMETYVFATQAQWEAKTRELLPRQARQFANLGSGGYTTRGVAVFYDLEGSDTYAIAAHEGWHQYTQTVFRSSLPVWLEEGIATYMETVRLNRDDSTRFRPTRNMERWYALRRGARRDQLIPFDELLRRTPQMFLADGKSRLLLYYAQVWALTRFILEGENGRYAPALSQLLADTASGSFRVRGSDPGASMAVLPDRFGVNIEDFEVRYFEFVDELTSVSGRSAWWGSGDGEGRAP